MQRDDERRLSLREAAEILGVSEITVRRWIKSGKLRAYQPGRSYQIPENAIEKLLEESEAPKVHAPSVSELSTGRGSSEVSIFDVVYDAARRQYRQDWQARNRMVESGQPQTYFVRHRSDARAKLQGRSQDELIEGLLDLGERCVDQEQELTRLRKELEASDVPERETTS